MIVKCGRCQTQFDVPGPGRFNCPACGTVNELRDPGAAAGGHLETPPPPPPPDEPSPRVECSSCGLSFIVGEVESAPCPNCGIDVEVVA